MTPHLSLSPSFHLFTIDFSILYYVPSTVLGPRRYRQTCPRYHRDYNCTLVPGVITAEMFHYRELEAQTMRDPTGAFRNWGKLLQGGDVEADT